MDNNFPCKECGAKKRFHRKGCSLQVKRGQKVEEKPESIPAQKVDEYTCPVCNIPLKRSNCGRGPYCQHMIPLEIPCPQCKEKYNNKIYWNCPKCKYLKADIPPVKDWRINLMPRVDGVYEDNIEDIT